MQFSLLPEDILTDIFKYSQPVHYSYSIWKQQLVLLAVCKRWRCVALPIVCRYVGFAYQLFSDDGDCPEPSEENLRTNLDKIVVMEHADLVRHLDISIDCEDNPFPYIVYILQRLAACSSQWSGISALSIEVQYNLTNAQAEAIEMKPFKADIDQILALMRSILPSIRKLEFQDFFPSKIAKVLYGQITGTYAQNLKQLIDYQPLQLNSPVYFSGLSYLDIHSHNTAFAHFLSASIDTLVKLKLDDVSDDFTWPTQSVNNIITFTNLKQLELSYSTPELEQSNTVALANLKLEAYNQPTLHFPKLKQLLLSGEPRHHPILAKSVFSSALDFLKIKGCIDSIQTLGRIKLPAIKSISLFAENSSHGNINRAVDAIYAITNLGIPIVDLGLSIIHDVSVDFRECHAYPPLTYLSIIDVSNVNEMLHVLSILPHLVTLGIYSVDSDSIEPEELLGPVCNHEYVQPLNKSIRNLNVAFDGNVANSNTDIALLTHLLITLPAIRRVEVWNASQDIAPDVVSKYKLDYPHLNNITFGGIFEHEY